MIPKNVEAKDIRPGDVIEVWWRPHRDTVRMVRPYEGPLDVMQGGFVFEFELNSAGMSAAPGDWFRVIGRVP